MTSFGRSGFRAVLRRTVFAGSLVGLFYFACILTQRENVRAEEVPVPAITSVGAMPSGISLLKEENRGRVPEGLFVDGISLAGKTPDEARRFFIDRGMSGEKRSVSYVFPGDTVPVDPAQVGLSWTAPHAFDTYYDRMTAGIDSWLALKDELAASPADIRIGYSVNTDTLAATLNTALGAHSSTKQNPTLSRVDGQFVVTEGVTGVSYDADAIFLDLVNRLVVWSDEASMDIVIPQILTPPDYESSVFAFSPQPLGSYTTYSLGSEERAGNIARSATLMNGHIFMPGDQISTLSMYGSVSLENGYRYAGGFESGKVIDVIGGGVCQTTTTLYNAVLRAELGIVYRRQHSMLVAYVPPAMDATVVPASGSDFVFQNTTSHAIYIESYVSGDSVTVNIWGCEERPANRTIGFSTQVLDIAWPSQLYTQVISDTTCHYGRDWVWNKQYTDATPHPYVHAISYKHVYIDGVETEVSRLNEDVYNMSSGVIVHASDCMVFPSLVDSSDPGAVYPYLGKSFYLHVTDAWGNPWPGM